MLGAGGQGCHGSMTNRSAVAPSQGRQPWPPVLAPPPPSSCLWSHTFPLPPRAAVLQTPARLDSTPVMLEAALPGAALLLLLSWPHDPALGATPESPPLPFAPPPLLPAPSLSSCWRSTANAAGPVSPPPPGTDSATHT